MTPREARQAKGWKLKDLARHSGVSITTLSRAERGMRPASLAVITAVQEAFGGEALEWKRMRLEVALQARVYELEAEVVELKQRLANAGEVNP